MPKTSPDGEVPEDRLYGINSKGNIKHSHTRTSSGSGIKRLFRRGSPGKGNANHTPVESTGNALTVNEEDHMFDSPFRPGEVCPGCLYPRSSSVWCPVTQRHHGTDELMTPGRGGSRKKSMDGNMKAFFHLFKKKDINAGEPRDTTTPTQQNICGLPPLSPSHPKHREEAEDEDDGKRVVVSPQSSTGATAATVREHAHTLDEDAPAEAEAAGGGGEEEEDVHYYCYTDENGETFYYAAEMTETVQKRESGVHSAAAAASTKQQQHSDQEQPTQAPSTYIYETVDEEGNIVHYMCEQPPEGEEGTAAEEEQHENLTTFVPPASRSSSTDSRTSAGNNAQSTTTPRRKGFLQALSGVLRKKQEKSSSTTSPRPHVHNRHVDATGASMDGTSNLSPSSAAASTTNHNGASAPIITEGSPNDVQVQEFMNTLNASDVKKFEKERKRLVKELESFEKKERERLMKQRKVFTEDLTRERRAGVYDMRSSETKIRKASAEGEPM